MSIDVRSRECYHIESAKQQVLELKRVAQHLNHRTYIDGLIDSLWNELEYQHELLRSPQLSQLDKEQS